MSELEGAGERPAPNVRISSAAEFAAAWNAQTPRMREMAWLDIHEALEQASQLFVRDLVVVSRQVYERVMYLSQTPAHERQLAELLSTIQFEAEERTRAAYMSMMMQPQALSDSRILEERNNVPF